MRRLRRNKSAVATYDRERLFAFSALSPVAVLERMESAFDGLSEEEVDSRRSLYGANEIEHAKKRNPVSIFIKAFINPFIGVLTVLVVVSYVLDVLLADSGEQDWTAIIIISVMVVASTILRFMQEWKAAVSSNALLRMVNNKCNVRRVGEYDSEISIAELVPGDIVTVAAGDMFPADIRLIEAKDLFISQSSLTGESDPVEKSVEVKVADNEAKSIVELENICYMGSNVVSGSATGVVIATGNDTYLGSMARSMAGRRATTAFDKGISRVSFLLIRFMLIMVPFVFLINGVTKGDWFDAFIFAVSVAVGLTPEMLPMIVTANLSRGAVVMSRKKTIVKELNAIQNFGAMNILCTDKTGTLTCDNIVLEKYMDADGNDDKNMRILRHAYFNSFFQTGLKNLIDKAILSHVKELQVEHLLSDYRKVDEIPFDFTRRRMSVVVENNDGKRQIITKGAVEEMLEICSFAETGGEVRPLSAALKEKAMRICRDMNEQGLRVLAVAQRSYPDKECNFRVEDECDMVLIGYLAFLDPPKPSAATALKQLLMYGVEVKILSGDSDAVVRAIARKVGIDTEGALTGPEMERMSKDERQAAICRSTVFSKLTPDQKTQIISVLQEQGNTVGFLGDGINDAPALRQSDIGISVDSAVDIAKESADIILLEKDLTVLEDGILEGRKTFGNIIKYVKMTASSNFGNMLSVTVASAFLPFLPMLPVHLLMQNLLYDLSQSAIPFDRMDASYLRKPRKWDASDLCRFMILTGPVSSLFDVATYLVMWYAFGCNSVAHQALFQSGWFIEGLLSQTLIVHMIRTRRIPFIQSRASWQVSCMTLLIVSAGLFIPFSSLGLSVNLVPLPMPYFFWLAGILTAYCISMQLVKNMYVRRFGRWL